MILTIVRGANPADAEAIANVQVASWRESYQGIIPKTALDALSVPERTDRWREILAQVDRQSLYVAEQEGRIVGFAEGGKSPSDELGRETEIYAIYLLSEVKRQGIGTKLLKALVNEFMQRGANSAGLWVFKENYPARRFYERLGARLAVEKINTRFGVTDLGYVWADLRSSFPS